MWYFLILFLILSFLQFLYILKNKKIEKKFFKIFLLTVICLLYIILFSMLLDFHKPHPLPMVKYNYSGSVTPVLDSTAQLLSSRQSGNINNLYFLYLESDKSQNTVTDIAIRLRRQYCTTGCIINIYDDKNAYSKDMERITIKSIDIMNEWNKNNYIFVADHYLGYLDINHNAVFAYYPFHDWYYRTHKNGK